MDKHGYMLGEVEGRFADIIWEKEPVTSSELVKIGADVFGWKRTTTHNVIRRLCDKGLFCRSESGTVTALLTKEEYCAQQSGSFVDRLCGGSLPMFVSGFVKQRKLSGDEISEIIELLRRSEESRD